MVAPFNHISHLNSALISILPFDMTTVRIRKVPAQQRCLRELGRRMQWDWVCMYEDSGRSTASRWSILPTLTPKEHHVFTAGVFPVHLKGQLCLTCVPQEGMCLPQVHCLVPQQCWGSLSKGCWCQMSEKSYGSAERHQVSLRDGRPMDR